MVTILYIDDEPDLREEIASELRDEGFEVIEAVNGADGYKKFCENQPDLTLCDVNMPGMTGFELLGRIRSSHESGSWMPFIFLSACSDETDIIRGMNLGSDSYLTKPVDFDLLHSTIDNQLERVQRQERDKENSLGDLRMSILRSLPHELRTPLTAIIGFAELIKQETFGPIGNEQYKEYIDLILRGASDVHKKVEDVLTLLDLKTGNLRPQLMQFDIAPLLNDCTKSIQPDIEKAGITLERHSGDEALLAWADSDMLRRVVGAVLSNAVKFNKSGGHIDIHSGIAECGGVEIQISDTGIGIPPDCLKSVAKVFDRLSNPMDSSFQGMGLGLSLASELTEAMGGTIGMSSSEGEGTRVSLNFPELAGV